MTAPVAPHELLALDSLLSDDEIAMRDSVRRLCADQVRPHVSQWFEQGDVPVRELARQFGDLGLLGMHLQG